MFTNVHSNLNNVSMLLLNKQKRIQYSTANIVNQNIDLLSSTYKKVDIKISHRKRYS